MGRGWFRFAARLVVALAILAASFVSIALTLAPRSVDAPIPSTLSAERPVGNPATIRVQAVAGVRAAGQADEAPVALVDAAPPQGPIVLPGLSVGVEVAALPSAEFVAFGETLAETVAAHDGSTRYAIAITDLQTGYTVGANHLRQQLSGCVMNLFVILQAVLDVQEGRYPLETVDALIRATTWSSNAVTARELYGITGGGDPVEGVRRVAALHEDLELDDMVIDHPPAYRGESVGVDPNNWLSASAVNIALEEIWQGDMLTAESRAYLLEVLAGGSVRFTFSRDAEQLRDGLLRWLEDHGGQMRFEDALAPLGDRYGERFAVKRAWLETFAGSEAGGGGRYGADTALEAAALIVAERKVAVDVAGGSGEVVVEGLLGQHPRVVDGKLELRLDEVLARLQRFRTVDVPGFRAWRKLRAEVVEQQRRRLRLEELQPRPLTSFVRNQLVDQVYLPLVGDNLAKQ
ncbi:MAG: hypothetical protein KC470_13320, partial [Dehalococcoidia bacterium]|nr:hypothetical protein [Dehalococcoidia bacterium]